jgi:hypothetical protein
MAHDLYLLTAVVVALTMLTLVVGYARVLFSAKRAAFHIAASTCLVFFAFAARAWFWDLGEVFGYGMQPMEINAIFNVLAIWSAMHGHYALYIMIPEADKAKRHWNIFTAWMYPPWLLFHELGHIVNKIRHRR